MNKLSCGKYLEESDKMFSDTCFGGIRKLSMQETI
jgi:hypothetical protein